MVEINHEAYINNMEDIYCHMSEDERLIEDIKSGNIKKRIGSIK